MNELLAELKKYYGEDAVFREGQEEAIESLLEGRRILVVQKTGWGKSLVYFMAAKMLRERLGGGFALIVSPLLALMNNQVESAARLRMEVRTVNSANKKDWDSVFDELRNDCLDALIIAPERLANEEFRRMLNEDGVASKIRLFVVDEAHCISDWGHDFRPDYRRIAELIQGFPTNLPILATTATANDRVVADICGQLGEGLQVIRGDLMRESLAIQVVWKDTKEERLAWIAKTVPLMPGSGIVYCLTVSDCQLVAKWLQFRGISSEAYYAEVDKKEGKDKDAIIRKFMENEIKVLVATVAFGMGFDKPDVGFVIHFQKPGNLVAYYQQIGRAGRAIDKAYAVLLCGSEDDAINEYFIHSAFPTENLMNEVVRAAAENDGLRLTDFEGLINMGRGKIEQCLKYLTVSGDLYRDKNMYYKTAKPWAPDLERSAKITEIRREELRQMNDFAKYDGCYMRYIAKALDDATTSDCGKCANCVGHPLFDTEVSQDEIFLAQQFVRESFNVIEPRKKWPTGIENDGKNQIGDAYVCETGWVLSNYGDAGWGRVVSKGKYKDGFFSDELVEASYKLLKDHVEKNQICWVCAVPSLRRPDLVRNFAVRLAQKLGLPFKDALHKTKLGSQQKEQNNSYSQYTNVFSSLEATDPLPRNVLLVDDMVDSRWTLTVSGYLLRKAGSGKVYPFALANTSGGNGGD